MANMMSARTDAPPAGAGWRRAAALALAVAAIGLPVNHVAAYLLLIVAVIIFTGEVAGRASAWVAAAAIVVAALGGQWLLSPPRMAEGHNVFLPGPPEGVLQRSLPAAVYRHMADEFDRQYPPAVRCRPGALAFSADSVFHPSDLSRSVTVVNFSDPVSLRLGFINELRYNWYTSPPDVHRAGGGEKVFYYGGPGLRYFRALEHVVFGESYLGYLSLVLLLPLLTCALARRFLPQRWAIGVALIFVAIPVGELFGTTFLDYAK
jgi:hypothetical protein